jgi:hypothetical protein
MSVYTVRSGDTLWGIARSNNIRYWPNMYFATENNGFRDTRSNPDRIFPGDRITIPSRESIAEMERRPVVRYRDVPLFTQSEETCWRATGKMLYARNNRTANLDRDFNARIGNRYRTMGIGLPWQSWNDFYKNRLHMQETIIASPNDLHRIIARRGPVIAMIGSGATAHSMIISGYDIHKGRWLILDPAAGSVTTFSAEIITAGGGTDDTNIDSSNTELEDYSAGPATLANMERWLWMFDTTMNQRIFHY